jgi:hypothetical protein
MTELALANPPEPVFEVAKLPALPRPISLASLRDAPPARSPAEEPMGEQEDDAEIERTIMRAPRQPQPVATATFNTGQRIEVTDAVLIGRRPLPTESLAGRPVAV